jgi:hypothetical protein
MEEVALLMGRKSAKPGSVEIYQLKIGKIYALVDYDGSEERGVFYSILSDDFVSRIIDKGYPSQIRVLNGYGLNRNTGLQETLPRLEDNLAETFSELFVNKLKLSRGLKTRAYPTPSLN